jgi:TPR repeat protein
MGEIWNEIARELLCPLSKTLAVDPVLCEDGFVYEREALELLRSKSNPFSVPLIAQCPFHSKLKSIIEKLVSTGEVNQEYLGRWTEKSQTSSESAAFVKALEGAMEGDTKYMVELGEIYLNGEVVDRDEEKAYGYFERASEEDDEIGTARKADCLLTGTGVVKDFKEGYTILIEAAQMDRSGEIYEHQFLVVFLLYSCTLPLTYLLGHYLVNATLRLIYFYKEGIFGFEQDESARTKWASHMKEISPQIGEHILEEKMSALKESLSNLSIPSPSHYEDEPKIIVENETDSDSLEGSKFEEAAVQEAPQIDSESTPKASTDIDSDGKPTKKCVECETSKPQTEFTASQWKKNAKTVRCSVCVSKLPAYQAFQLQQKKCQSCGISKAFECFSLNQWRKKQGERRCCDCVKKGTLDHIPLSSLRCSNVFHT